MKGIVRERVMTQRILVIDKCSDCTNIGTSGSDMICQIENCEVNPDTIPKWCPLPDTCGDV